MAATLDISTPSVLWREMSKRWELLQDLMGGTLVMRDRGEKWLPREAEESPERYLARLGRSILLEAYPDTVEQVASRPFTKPVKLVAAKGLPSPLDQIKTNVDGSGTQLTEFCHDVFSSALHYGHCHILVDFPPSKAANLSDFRKNGHRPRFIKVDAPDLFFWRTEDNAATGLPELSEIRIKECVVQSDGKFADKLVERIRVITKTDWSLYTQTETKDGKKIWTQTATATHTFGKIPLVTYYVNPKGLMVSQPPFEKIGWLNLAHWQSQSDQRNILRYVRCGVLLASGFDEDEINKIVISVNSVIRATNADAKLSWVEHTGKAVEAGERDLRMLEEKMEQLGMRPLVERTATATATGKTLDEKSKETKAQHWVRLLEIVIADAYKLAAQWVSVELPEDFKIDVFSDFAIGSMTAVHLQALQVARQMTPPVITRATYINEMKSRGVLSDTLDTELELQHADEEFMESYNLIERLNPTSMDDLETDSNTLKDEDNGADQDLVRENNARTNGE